MGRNNYEGAKVVVIRAKQLKIIANSTVIYGENNRGVNAKKKKLFCYI